MCCGLCPREANADYNLRCQCLSRFHVTCLPCNFCSLVGSERVVKLNFVQCLPCCKGKRDIYRPLHNSELNLEVSQFYFNSIFLSMTFLSVIVVKVDFFLWVAYSWILLSIPNNIVCVFVLIEEFNYLH